MFCVLTIKLPFRYFLVGTIVNSANNVIGCTIMYEMLLQREPSSTLVPPLSEAGFLFNTYKHLQHQQKEGVYILSAVNTLTRLADARCAFFVQSGKAISPIAAPFGSIECASVFPEEALDLFIQTLIQAVHSAGAITLRLVNYPLCYAPESAGRVAQKLLSHGFIIVETHQTFYLPVSNTPFDLNLVPAERRRLTKCFEAGFQFKHWPLSDKNGVINFLTKTRRQKGYTMTISPERLTDLLHTFPNECAVFTVMDGDTIAALTITVRVRHDILYNFQPASNPGYDAFSPMVLLIRGLYTYCQQHQIGLLDLGPSLDENRQAKPGLARFKRNLGAQESPRLVFERDLSVLSFRLV